MNTLLRHLSALTWMLMSSFPSLASTITHRIDSLYGELDKAIAHADEYVAQREQRITDLRKKLSSTIKTLWLRCESPWLTTLRRGAIMYLITSVWEAET